MTDKLTTLPNLINSINHGTITYNTSGTGSCFGTCIYNDGDVAIQRLFMEKGTIFSYHSHPCCIEWLVIKSGKLQIYYEDGHSIIIDPLITNYIVFAKECGHKIVALEDTWMLGITIPAGKGYPIND